MPSLNNSCGARDRPSQMGRNFSIKSEELSVNEIFPCSKIENWRNGNEERPRINADTADKTLLRQDLICVNPRSILHALLSAPVF